MEPFPHHYQVSASARSDSNVTLRGEDLPELVSAPPRQFDGPGNHWSPEELLLAALADCFILTFRAIASASRFEWLDLECVVEGQLDRVERVTRFTGYNILATLTVPADVDQQKAVKLMEKAEHGCLVSNSVKAERHLVTTVRTPD